MPISRPVYTSTLSSPPPAAPVPPSPSSSQFAVPKVPPMDGQVPPRLAAEAVSPGRHNIFKIIYKLNQYKDLHSLADLPKIQRHAFPVIAPPPNRRHRLLLGVLVGQRHGVLHGGHEVWVRSQPGTQ